jgi:hypothetical protein
VGTAGGARQNGMSWLAVTLAGSLKGLSLSSTGSAGLEDSADFGPFPFFGGLSNLSMVTTTSVRLRFCPSPAS